MKFRTLLACIWAAAALTASGQAEWRTYTSEDGARTFEGQLQAYDAGSETVTVLNRQRQAMSFNIGVLSEADRKYITETAPTLPVRARLDVRYQTLQERQSASRTDTTRRSESEAGYEVTINNFSPIDLKGAVIEYAIIYRKDSANGPATTEVIRGSKQIDIEANGTHSFETTAVQLVSSHTRPQAVG